MSPSDSSSCMSELEQSFPKQGSTTMWYKKSWHSKNIQGRMLFQRFTSQYPQRSCLNKTVVSKSMLNACPEALFQSHWCWWKQNPLRQKQQAGVAKLQLCWNSERFAISCYCRRNEANQIWAFPFPLAVKFFLTICPNILYLLTSAVSPTVPAL